MHGNEIPEDLPDHTTVYEHWQAKKNARVRHLFPEVALAAEVFKAGILDYLDQSSARKLEFTAPALREDAAVWLFSKPPPGQLYSFDNLCVLFDLDPGHLRSQVKRIDKTLQYMHKTWYTVPQIKRVLRIELRLFVLLFAEPRCKTYRPMYGSKKNGKTPNRMEVNS